MDIPTRVKLTLHGPEVQLCDQRDETLDLMLIDAEVQIPQSSTFAVLVPTMQPTKIGEALHHYWSQYWQRDHPDDTWEAFENFLNQVPRLPPVQPREDLQMWMWAIKKLEKTTAKGTCGWAAEELQSMPPQAIEDLVYLVTNTCTSGFPRYMMLARTLPIGKVTMPESPSQTRPITILSILYRTWGKACCTQVLRHWAKEMPPEMIGFLPSRNMSVHMIKYQHNLELIQEDSAEEAGGLTLDLTKAFNLIAHKPAAAALKHTGIPTTWIDQWKGSQQVIKRTWEVASQSLWSSRRRHVECALYAIFKLCMALPA